MSFLATSDYFARPLPEENWLVEHLIPRGGTVQLYGKPKSGKSFLALTLASALGDGAPYFLCREFRVKTRGTVLFLQLDTPPGLWTEYLHTTARPYGAVRWADAMQVPEPPFDINMPVHQTWLHNQVVEHEPVLLVVDSLRELHRGDENDSAVMTKVFARLRKAIGLDCAVLLLHHQKKIGAMEVPDLIDSSRGASYIAGKVDVLMRLTGQDPEKKVFDYTGRTRIVTKSLKLWQDTETGLLYHGSKRHQSILTLFQNTPSCESVSQFVALCQAQGIPGSPSTLRRDIEELGLFNAPAPSASSPPVTPTSP